MHTLTNGRYVDIRLNAEEVCQITSSLLKDSYEGLDTLWGEFNNLRIQMDKEKTNED